MRRSRSAFICPLFGDICEIKENVLPTYEDVMKYYEWTRHHLKLESGSAKEPTFTEVANIVTSRIVNIWHNVSIPIVSRTRVVQMLNAYHTKCKNLLKSVKRLSPEKLESFRQNSKKLFDISACKCKEFPQCICPKDRKVPKQEQTFLIDQRTSRIMIIGGINGVKKLQKNLKRQHEKNSRLSISSNTSTLPVSDFSTSPSSASDNEIIENIPEKKIKTDRQPAAASSVLFDIRSDVEVIGKRQLRRQRSKIREKSVQESIVPKLSAHFDGTKDKTLNIIQKDGKYYRALTIEEHISLIQEPGSTYIGYIAPKVSTAKGLETAITELLSQENIPQHHLKAIALMVRM